MNRPPIFVFDTMATVGPPGGIGEEGTSTITGDTEWEFFVETPKPPQNSGLDKLEEVVMSPTMKHLTDQTNVGFLGTPNEEV